MLNNPARRTTPQIEKRASVAARCLAVYVVVSIGRLTDLLPFAHSWPLAKIAFAIVLIAAVHGRPGFSPVPLRTIDLARAVAAFAALVVVSVIFSVWISQSLKFVTTSFLTVVVGFFISVKILARWADIRIVLKAVAVVGLILAAEALAGYSGGRAYVESMYDTNDLAYLLMGVLPITLSFGVVSSALSRIFWFGVSALIVVAGLLTQSRGGLLALAAIVLLLVWRPLRGSVTKPGGTRSRAGGLMVRTLLAVLLTVAAWAQLPHDAQQRLGLLFSLKDDYNTDLSETSSRSSIWKRNVIAGIERPIGSGVDTFPFVDGRTGGHYKAPHNSVLEVFVELGVLGLVVWARLWFLGLRSLGVPPPAVTHEQPAVAQQTWREQYVMAQALRISLVALFVGGFFLSQAYSLIFWQLLAVCAATSALFGTNAKRVTKFPPRRQLGALR
jgi:O-antigen ligase